VTDAEAGPPVGLPAGTGRATGLAKAVPTRAAVASAAEKKCILDKKTWWIVLDGRY
jgi:hypothetical protein